VGLICLVEGKKNNNSILEISLKGKQLWLQGKHIAKLS